MEATESCNGGSGREGRRKPLRVMHLTSSIGFYGAERVIITLVKALAARGVANLVASLEKNTGSSMAIVNAARLAGVPACEIPCRGRIDWRVVQRLRTLLREERIDVLHSHEPKSRFYGAIASRLEGVDMVTTQHNWTRQDLRTTLVEHFDACCLHFAGTVIAVSQPVADSLQRIRIPAKRIEMIPNGIDLAGFGPAMSSLELRRSLGISPGVPVVGTVGRLDSAKGHDLLLDAARIARDLGCDAVYLIVGEGVERANLESRVRALGLTKQVCFAGYQTAVQPFVALMDVFALASRREGTPMALLEAMAMNRPVVATPVGGVTTVITNGFDGLLLKERTATRMAEALLTVLRDVELAQRLGYEGRRTVERQFSGTRMAELYEEVYYRSQRSVDKPRAAARRAKRSCEA